MFTIGVWFEFAILAAVIAVMAWMVKSPSQVAPALLMAILIVDLLSALPYDIKPDGIEFYAISAKETQPSVHALAIARALEPTQGRALAIGGTQVDEVLPATFARVWRIPIAGGYGAMFMGPPLRPPTQGTHWGKRAGGPSRRGATLGLLARQYVIVQS